MQYALLIYGDEKRWEEATEEERTAIYANYTRFGEMLQARGALRGGAELGSSSAATTVRGSGADAVLVDGPFAEAREQLGGFYLVEASDLDEAVEFARVLPAETVEVRPLVAPPQDTS